ncbi:MAG: slipin family protein [Rhodobacteraceae bacterium]|nr:slipin family protein [Paracoccaceae bacterium]
MEWINALFDRLTGHTRVTVSETERMLVLRNGRFDAILGPGEHRLKRRNLQREVHRLDRLRFVSPYDRALYRERPDLAEAHLTEMRAGADEACLVLRDGRPAAIVRPEDRAVYWTDAGPWDVARIALGETLALPEGLAKRLVAVGLTDAFQAVEVAEGHVGMLTVDGSRAAAWGPDACVLETRAACGGAPDRPAAADPRGHRSGNPDQGPGYDPGQPDGRLPGHRPERAVAAVHDFEEALHRALQLAFRRTLGALTLDRLLAEKVSVDAQAAEAVRAEMAGIGIELGEIALKDVILPGEMRDILTAVVAAEKQAEANVIRRREETNATRSLLNTAKVMAENPVMLRLKELAALETIAGKVERLTVHNGTAGLMTDLVRLRD